MKKHEEEPNQITEELLLSKVVENWYYEDSDKSLSEEQEIDYF